MTLKEELDRIGQTNNFGNFQIEKGKKKSVILSFSYYSSLIFGDIPEKYLSKEVKSISQTGDSGRVDYIAVLA